MHVCAGAGHLKNLVFEITEWYISTSIKTFISVKNYIEMQLYEYYV